MQIDLLNNTEAAILRDEIAASNHIVVCCHQNADGDALGSSLAWAEYLRLQGKEPVVIVPDMYPDFLQWLPNSEKIVRYDKHTEAADLMIRTSDLIFCMDFNTFSRTGEKMSVSLHDAAARKILIDHHPDPDIDTVLSVSHPLLSSTCEVVFRLIWQLGGFPDMHRKIAIPIYCGMMTDTGGFTFNSNRPEIFFIISQLLTKHIDKDRIYRNVYHNYSEWRMRLMGYVLQEKLKVMSDCHAAYYVLTRHDLKRFHFMKGDAEGLVNLPLQIKGLKLSISLREDTERDNLIWVSLRSVDNFSCTEVANLFFNGGGHLNASGGKLYCSVGEAENVVVRAIRFFEDELK